MGGSHATVSSSTLAAGGPLGCSISETVDCAPVWKSDFAVRARELTGMPVAASTAFAAPMRPPDKIAVLTFDDAVKSHRTFVAPLLKELGFDVYDPQHAPTWRNPASLLKEGVKPAERAK